ncbi:replication protein A 32 kDa subunit A-like [Bidens hawaiensis]|uniref:replication protein A 32 kDa subunit A-like n=1 Tax=Bidens hawaiensis TaxID=980011 RepID=UPI00404982FB
MFSESQFDGGSQIFSSPATAAANRETPGLVPLTIKQISEASHSGDDKSNFTVSGADVVNVTVVGMVFNIVERNTDVTFTLDDGTGKLDCKIWLNEPFDRLQMEEVKEGIYVHVDGHLKSFKGVKHVAVFSVRPVTNFDEITFHFIASIHHHMSTSKVQKIQNGDSDTINSTPKTVSVVGMVFNMVDWNNDVTFTLDDGTGKLDCKRCLNELSDRLQMEEIREGIYVHVHGHLRSFKGETHVDVFSARPVTNLDEITFHFIASIHVHTRTDKVQPLEKIQNGENCLFHFQQSVPFNLDGLKGVDQMVLAYLQLPANSGNEKGTHTDGLAQMLKLPINKIMKSIRMLEDEGVIYSTIDEFHYKAA